MINSRSEIATHNSLLENAPEHLKLIGLIAVKHAHLDRTLCRLLAILADLDMSAAPALVSMPPTSRAIASKILANLPTYRSLSHESAAQLEACLACVKRCSDLRDEMIKSAYGIARDGLVISPGKDECGEIMPVTKAQLQQLAADIANCTAKLDRFASMVGRDEELRQYSRAEDSDTAEVAS
jgi:hypothetical protein